MGTEIMILLPEEVQNLALRVSEKKKDEVNTVLNQIFAGTADWEKQVDAIEVKGVHDNMSIQLADVARRNVKNARLAAEKIFDAKRDEVQNAKAEFDLEDKLWLKAKQVMQLKFKAIEEKAEWKARTVERYEAEQKELRTQLRLERTHKFNPDVNRIDVENMSDEMFTMFISGIEKAHNDKIEAERKAEAERIAKEKAEAEERERIRLENERLKKEAEAKEKQLVAERAKAESERKALEEKARKEREESERKFREEQERARLEAQKAAAERAKLEAEIRAKNEEQERIRKQKELAEKQAQLEFEKALKAPRKQRLTSWIDQFIMFPPTEMDNDETVIEIIEKFESFKKWAKTKIENI
jgi:hypothetical protein